MITIREWMKNKTILISGGAGFLGKVLIEKLLRCCPGVERIYVIIRPKHGKSPEERWAEITKDPLFEKLLAHSPDVMDKKVTVLDGDMSLINFGLSQETIQELKNTVNIIYHSAASIRFNDPLHKAFLSNTRGTLEMCKLASETNNLEVFVYVSTTYCNCNLNKTYYEEKVYEPCQDWRKILKLIEKENPAVINTLSYKIIKDHPNTYTFTKSLSEKLVEEYSSEFPTVIARPSVVVSTLTEPIPGWTDSLAGIFGLTAGVCNGVLRIFKARKDCTLDYIPVDVAINALIVSSWEKANSEKKELSIYNCAYADTHSLSFESLSTQGMELNIKYYPIENDIWHPFLLYITNNFYFHLLFFLLQVVPAVVLDSILFLMKKKTRFTTILSIDWVSFYKIIASTILFQQIINALQLVGAIEKSIIYIARLIKLNIKIYHALKALEAFTMRDIKFDNNKYHALWKKLTKEDEEIFSIRPPSNFTWEHTLMIMQQGVKKYILKESFENAEYIRIKLRRLYYLDRFVRGLLITAGLMLLYKSINVTMHRYVL